MQAQASPAAVAAAARAAGVCPALGGAVAAYRAGRWTAAVTLSRGALNHLDVAVSTRPSPWPGGLVLRTETTALLGLAFHQQVAAGVEGARATAISGSATVTEVASACT